MIISDSQKIKIEAVEDIFNANIVKAIRKNPEAVTFELFN